MKICLFGGAFDPPHLGHLHVAQSMLDQHICDEVWFVPVKQHPFGKEIPENGRRENMLKLVITQGMKIDRYELEHPGKSYSFGTLEALSKQYPEHQFSWVIGTDNLTEFHKWYKFEELLQKYTVYVYPRHGYPFEPWYPGMQKIEQVEEVRISSTEVREKVRNTQPIADLVDPAVEQYIRDNNLYR